MYLYRLDEVGGLIRSENVSFADILPSQKTLNVICLLSVILLPLMWALMTFDKLAVSSEGWYVVYSKMILDGQMPYRDFELAFPPLYAYMMTFVVSVFGESLLAFRVIGVLLFIGLAILSYHIFKLIFPPWIAAVAAIVAVFIMQSENTFVGYDYIRFYDLFNYLAFFLLLRLIVRSYKKEPVNMNAHLFFAGVFCALAALLRQTSGLIVFVYFAVFLVLIFLFVKSVGFKHKSLYFFLIGCLVPVLITIFLLVLTGTLGPFIQMTLLSGSKGSLIEMLFYWVPRLLINDIVISILTVPLAWYFAVRYRKGRIDTCPAGGSDNLSCLFAVLAAVSIVVLFFFSLSFTSSFLPTWYALLTPMFLLNLVLGLIILFRVVNSIKREEQASLLDLAYLFFCGFIFAVGFGSGTSGGLSFGQSALNFGFIIAIIFAEINKLSRSGLRLCLKTTAVVLTVFLFVATPVSVKVATPYYWWGLTAENYSDAVYETDISYFVGIRLTANEKFVYEDFTEKAGLYLSDDDELYCFSQIGIFYILANRVPNVKAPIPWFDVARSSTVSEDLEYLRHNNPKMIVFGDYGEDVISAHEELFPGADLSGHRQMYGWLTECRDGSGSDYTVIETYSLHNYQIYLMLRN